MERKHANDDDDGRESKRRKAMGGQPVSTKTSMRDECNVGLQRTNITNNAASSPSSAPTETTGRLAQRVSDTAGAVSSASLNISEETQDDNSIHQHPHRGHTLRETSIVAAQREQRSSWHRELETQREAFNNAWLRPLIESLQQEQIRHALQNNSRQPLFSSHGTIQDSMGRLQDYTSRNASTAHSPTPMDAALASLLSLASSRLDSTNALPMPELPSRLMLSNAAVSTSTPPGLGTGLMVAANMQPALRTDDYSRYFTRNRTPAVETVLPNASEREAATRLAAMLGSHDYITTFQPYSNANQAQDLEMLVLRLQWEEINRIRQRDQVARSQSQDQVQVHRSLNAAMLQQQIATGRLQTTDLPPSSLTIPTSTATSRGPSSAFLASMQSPGLSDPRSASATAPSGVVAGLSSPTASTTTRENAPSNTGQPTESREASATTTATREEDKDQTDINGARIIPVALDTDKEVLSEYQSLVRKHVFFFQATLDDQKHAIQGRGRLILGQVGILCRHCAYLHPVERPKGATYFPTRLSGIYQTIQNMVSNHFLVCCERLPKETREKMRALKSKKETFYGGGKSYWIQGAKVLGITERDGYLVFETTPVSKAGVKPSKVVARK